MRDRTELTGELSIGQQLDAIDEAIAAEREACATIVEKLAGADVVYPEGIRMIAAAIRARGNKP